MTKALRDSPKTAMWMLLRIPSLFWRIVVLIILHPLVAFAPSGMSSLRWPSRQRYATGHITHEINPPAISRERIFYAAISRASR